MAYRIVIADSAQADIDEIARYRRAYTPRFWAEQEQRLTSLIETGLATSPPAWSCFFIMGTPYRACLFEAGRRMKYWIVYMIGEEAKTVSVLLLWNVARSLKDFRI